MHTRALASAQPFPVMLIASARCTPERHLAAAQTPEVSIAAHLPAASEPHLTSEHASIRTARQTFRNSGENDPQPSEQQHPAALPRARAVLSPGAASRSPGNPPPARRLHVDCDVQMSYWLQD